MPTHWTLEAMPDQTGKIVIVTGATHGIGYEAAKAFALKNATLILAVRDTALGQKRVEEFRALHPRSTCDVLALDLGSLASVRAFVAAFKAKYNQLHILINNAGIMAVPFGKTEDGFEKQIGVNYLGHFALTGLLLDVIHKTPGARIIPVASEAERTGNIPALLADFNFDKGYQRWTAYGHSKLAQVMFAYELNRRLQQHGYSAVAIGAHPGFARTNLRTTGMTQERNPLHRFLNIFFEWISQSQALGALPILYAATAPDAKGGEYYGTSRMQMWGYPAKNSSSAKSHDEAVAKQLWAKSEEVTGVRYTF